MSKFSGVEVMLTGDSDVDRVFLHELSKLLGGECRIKVVSTVEVIVPIPLVLVDDRPISLAELKKQLDST